MPALMPNLLHHLLQKLLLLTLLHVEHVLHANVRLRKPSAMTTTITREMFRLDA